MPQIRSYDPERNLVNNQPDTASVDIPVATGWNLFAQAVDRIMFVLYTVIILIFLGAYLGGAAVAIDSFKSV